MRLIKALLVDDESVARSLLRGLLLEVHGIDVIGESDSGLAAVDAIRALRPDLVFLDIQMPGVDGFGVIEAIGVDTMPAVVFVTAYDQHALRAFSVHALDYLLKPLDPDKVHEAATRVVTHLQRPAIDDVSAQLLAMLEQVRGGHQYLERLALRGDGRIPLISVDDVDWIEAADKHLVIHVGKVAHQMRGAISAIERELDPRRFRRVHRSAIVNVDRIAELQPWFQGEFVLILKDGTRVTTSAAYRASVQEIIRGA
jgi:two-component system LytT family response regulator